MRRTKNLTSFDSVNLKQTKRSVQAFTILEKQKDERLTAILFSQ